MKVNQPSRNSENGVNKNRQRPNLSIFKSYDIRGIYPLELDEDKAFRIGQSFAEYLKRINPRPKNGVIAGRDSRISSPNIFDSIAKGILSAGIDVYDIGMVPTELVYFGVGNFKYDGGIMITASHNPKEYNGAKMISKEKGRVEIIRGEDIAEIFYANSSFGKGEGRIRKKDIWQEYLKHLFSLVNFKKIKPQKMVLDASNGVAGEVLSRIISKLPVKPVCLNFQPDGNFPGHAPNPLAKGAADAISNKVKEENADFGFIFDGDADRIFLIDEKGGLARADVVLLMLARYFLEKNPGSAVSYNVVCSKAVPEFIKRWGGNPIRTKVGFVNVREGIIRENGVLGGEVSGHYCFRDNFYLDSGFMSFLTLLEIFSRSEKKVSELVSELAVYFKDEISFEVNNKEKILEETKEKYAYGKQDFLDGITIEYKDWWFNLRPSQTEPLLRLTIEAQNQSLLEEKKKELEFFIKEKNL